MRQDSQSEEEERRKERLLEGVRLTVHLLIHRLEASPKPELPQELPPWCSTALDEVAKTMIGPGEELAKLPESKQAYPLGKVLGRIFSFCCQFREGFPAMSELGLDEHTQSVANDIFLMLAPKLAASESELRQATAETAHRPHAWQSDFHRGLAQGFEAGVIEGPEEQFGLSQHAQVCLLLLFSWETVEALRPERGGGRKLHQWIVTV